ncbi:hypothetical protein JTB14_023480 [Gonioctena quinquepunctata]|nr:hypothetical protein JTB14_023480 [Gonioctena quinquepunctata]
MSKLEESYVKAASDNLTKVDSDIVNDFFIDNLNFLSAEVHIVKTKRACRTTYGDRAISYVQLKREGCIVEVKGKITPEHKINKEAYNVCAVVDEKGERIVSSVCLDGPASEDD